MKFHVAILTCFYFLFAIHPTSAQVRQQTEINGATDGRVDYLIVTTEELKPAFDPLLEWKSRKGLKTRVVTMEEIEDTYDNPTIQLKLKQCLFDYYTNNGLKWVLLGGDAELVPVQGCYSVVYSDDGKVKVEEWSIPTDLFYACFDGRFDWNGMVDDKIGQVFKDNLDLTPEVYISRVPVKNPEHVETFVGKILRYETDPPMKDFFGRMLLSGIKLFNIWNGMSDSQHWSENLYKTYVKDRWAGKKIGFYDTGSDFPGDSDFEVNVNNLSAQLNSGFGFFHFSGHGNTQFLVLENGDVFDTDDVMELYNAVPGIILTNACNVNAFDSIDPCFSEAFIRNPVGGGIAFFGSSRLGFDNPDSTSSLGPSFKYAASFAKYLFKDSPEMKWKSFASVAAMAKSDYAFSSKAGGAYNYLQYAINPIGDPELPLYTSDPFVFERIRMYRFRDELTVNTGGISDCRICVTSQDLKEGYQQVVEDVVFHTFEGIPGSIQVTITAPNYRPYVYWSGTATSVIDEKPVQVYVYPNPAREFIMIDIMEPEARIQFCDLNGRVFEDLFLPRGSHRLDLSPYPDGIYLLHLSSGSYNQCKKVVKQ